MQSHKSPNVSPSISGCGAFNKSSCIPSTTNRYSKSDVIEGRLKVKVLSPLSIAIGPASGSQPHHGPVNRTSFAPLHKVVVIVRLA